jgi:small-conductance mechanosensitive channel
MRNARRLSVATASVLALTCLLAAPRPAWGQNGDAPPTGTPPAPAETTPPPAESPAEAAPTSIPIVEVGRRASQLDERRRAIESELDSDTLVDETREKLVELETQVATEHVKIDDLLATGFATGDLDSIGAGWEKLRSEMLGLNKRLGERAVELEAMLREGQEQLVLWEETLQTLDTSAPADVRDQVVQAGDALRALNARLERHRNAVIQLETRVLRQEPVIKDVLTRLDEARAELRARLVVRDERPWWTVLDDLGAELATLRPAFDRAVSTVQDYVDANVERLVAHVIFILILCWIVRWARKTLARRSPAAPEDVSSPRPTGAAVALRCTWSAPVLLGLTFTRLFHPDAPTGFRLLIAIVLIPFWIRVVRALLPRALRWPVLLLAILVLLEALRRFVGVSKDGLPTLLAVGQLTLVLVLLLGLWWAKPMRHLGPELQRSLWIRLLDGWLRLVTILAALGWIATLLSFGRLGDMAAILTIGATYFGTIVMVAARIAEGIMEAVVVSGRLDYLRMVRTHRARIGVAINRGIRLVSTLAWVYVVLNAVSAWEPVAAVARRVLTAEAGYGSFTITLGGTIAFILTLWFSWLLARFISFALNQEVLARVHMAPGVPFAISTFTRYAILVIGFLIAISMLGFPVDRLTLLVSALGVGIGFGLQNVINNFISGVILLFERPIRVRDRVQLEDMFGTVERIGIRASVIHTFDGADVIVPNGEFISARVINWTLADQRRRIILPVGVAYGTDPRTVLEILESVAASNEETLEEPTPDALFMGFGEHALNFELRCWTGSGDWPRVRSDLAIATHDALYEAGIEIPLPKRDLNVRTVAPEAARAFSRPPGPSPGDRDLQ